MRRIRIFLIILLLINIIITLSLLLINNKNYNNEYEKTQDYFNERVIPRNSYELISNYKGIVDKDEIYKKLNIVIRYIPDLYTDIKDLSEDKLKEYYKDKNSIVKEHTGIDNYDEFAKLVSSIIESNIGKSEFSYASIVKNSVTKKGNITSFQIELVYKDEKAIKIDMHVNNSSKTKDNIKINSK